MRATCGMSWLGLRRPTTAGHRRTGNDSEGERRRRCPGGLGEGRVGPGAMLGLGEGDGGLDLGSSRPGMGVPWRAGLDGVRGGGEGVLRLR